jgi:ATP-dependent Lhr-like helicase
VNSQPTSFARLHPSVRYLVQASLGWRELRQVQEETIPPILDGATAIVTAPTAGGKTEAAMLPLFSRILTESLTPTSIIYIAPLRALLNDLGERLGGMAGQLGLSVGVWHGDVGQRERKRLLAQRPDVLLTTPESLEVLLSLGNEMRRTLLESLRAIVVDEVHAFYGVDRGVHLLALIERVQTWAQHDIQRIALSATIGNPEELATWFRGSSKRPERLVRVDARHNRSECFDVRTCIGTGGVSEAVRMYDREKVLIFARTRSDVEEITHALLRREACAWSHHSALSRETREMSERAFRDGRSGFLVATSTLELGIDIGDLDRVVQVDAPSTVAALLQRLGRSGRRPGADARMTFLPTNAEQIVLSLALLSLRSQGWVEPLQPPGRPFPVLVQQLLATILQTGGIARSSLVERLTHNAAFARIASNEIDLCIEHLLVKNVLDVADGSLVLGLYGERRYGRRAFSQLASVFSTLDTVTVVSGDREIGTLDRWFVDEMLERSRSSFLLSGKAWHVVQWPEAGSVLEVIPGSLAEGPLYAGGGIVLGFKVMQSVRQVLAAKDVHALPLPPMTCIDPDIHTCFEALRKESDAQRLAQPGTRVIADGAARQWFTYAGLRANRLLADLFRQSSEQTITVTNTSVRFQAAFETERFVEKLQRLREPDAIEAQLANLIVRHIKSYEKFIDVLPELLRDEFVRDRAYDNHGAASIVSEPISFVSENVF